MAYILGLFPTLTPAQVDAQLHAWGRDGAIKTVRELSFLAPQHFGMLISLVLVASGTTAEIIYSGVV